MNEPFPLDALVFETYQHYFEWLMKFLLISVGFLFAATVALIFFCCREEVRAGRKNDKALGRLRLHAVTSAKSATIKTSGVAHREPLPEYQAQIEDGAVNVSRKGMAVLLL